MTDEKFGSFELLKLKYRRGDQIIQLFCRIGSPQEIRSPLFYLKKLQKHEKSTTPSCRIHWNLLNDKKFGSFKLVKLKYRRGDQIIQPLWKIASSQEIRSPLFNLNKFQKPEKSTTASSRIHWNLKNNEEVGSFKHLKFKYRRGGPNNSAVLQNWFPSRN